MRGNGNKTYTKSDYCKDEYKSRARYLVRSEKRRPAVIIIIQ